MRFLKEKKGIVISFITGVILASSITAYATSYFAKDITYKDGKNVEQALNELYTKENNYIGNAAQSDVLIGKTFYSNSRNLQTGTFNPSSLVSLWSAGASQSEYNNRMLCLI